MNRPRVLAYYFPDWHHDPRNERWFGPGWTEWELVRAARPRFEGHRLPRSPALGARDEADPECAAVDIALARAHGVDGFLVDYYWYDDGSYLSGALDDGLLRAKNVDEIEFALMWANHQLVDIFPSHDATSHPVLKEGEVDRAAFEAFAHTVTDRYFHHPSYLRIDGAPWLTIYQLGSLVAGLGGVEATVDALGWFRDLVRSHGFPDLHLDAVIRGFGVLPGSVIDDSPSQLLSRLGVNTATSYVWIHHADLGGYDFPVGDVARLREEAFAAYEQYARTLPVPFYPNVTVGWDSTARTDQQLPFAHADYPWLPVFDASPDEFRRGLQSAKAFGLQHPTPHPVVTVNAWNEWSEGSVLLPDLDHGSAYLEAIRDVFGPVPGTS